MPTAAIAATVRGYSDFLAFAATRGVDPKTVFDVGVGFGTPWLYEAFAKLWVGAHLTELGFRRAKIDILLEPLDEPGGGGIEQADFSFPKAVNRLHRVTDDKERSSIVWDPTGG